MRARYQGHPPTGHLQTGQTYRIFHSGRTEAYGPLRSTRRPACAPFNHLAAPRSARKSSSVQVWHFPSQRLRLGGDALGADPTYLLYLPSRPRAELRRIDLGPDCAGATLSDFAASESTCEPPLRGARSLSRKWAWRLARRAGASSRSGKGASGPLTDDALGARACARLCSVSSCDSSGERRRYQYEQPTSAVRTHMLCNLPTHTRPQRPASPPPSRPPSAPGARQKQKREGERP